MKPVTLRETFQQYPWWLWPNLLSLDAPVVAVVWQRHFADELQPALSYWPSLALVLIVWAVYLLDRVWDAPRQEQPQAERHQFAHQHRRTWVSFAVMALTLAAIITPMIRVELLQTGAFVAVAVVVYLVAIHILPPCYRWPIHSKEFAVGAIFAAGVAVPVITFGESWRVWLSPVLAFGILCWWNCQLIHNWETATTQGRWQALAFAVVAVSLSWPSDILLIGLSAFGLFLLNELVNVLSLQSRRVLADVVLLSPLLEL